MTLAAVKKQWLSGDFLYNRKLAAALWFGLSFIAVAATVQRGGVNNFEVFRHVYFHTLQKVNLYLFYPHEYDDVNLYGPVFSIIIAPFAFLPVKIGAVCWEMCNAAFLYVAIYKLPIHIKWRTAIVVLCAHEMMITASWLQSNAMVCGCLMLAYTFTLQKKEPAALFFIMLPAFIKLYGIVGIVFICFSKKPLRFIMWAFIWSVFFFFLPLLITDLSFIIQSYYNWYEGLQVKAAKNIRIDINNFFQDISIMGLIRRNLYAGVNDKIVLLSGMLAMASQFIYFRYFTNHAYRLYILASLLVFVVIFSTGSESPTYIIALPGICLWYFMQPKTKPLIWFFIFAWVLTTLSYSDIFTPWVRTHIVKPYSLKALPACVVWIIMLIQIHRKQFLRTNNIAEA